MESVLIEWIVSGLTLCLVNRILIHRWFVDSPGLQGCQFRDFPRTVSVLELPKFSGGLVSL